MNFAERHGGRQQLAAEGRQNVKLGGGNPRQQLGERWIFAEICPGYKVRRPRYGLGLVRCIDSDLSIASMYITF